MSKLLKISTALILIECINYSANAAAVAPLTTASPAQPVVKTPKTVNPSTIECMSVSLGEPGFAPVPGQLNIYQRAMRGGGGCGVKPAPTPVGFVTTLPAGVKLLDKNNNPVVLTQPVKATYDGPVPISAPAQPITSQPAPAPVTPTPVTNPTLLPAQIQPPSSSVEWMPTTYYRFKSPDGTGMIYVNDNNGSAYLQNANGTKTTLSSIPKGIYYMRPAEFQVPGWVLQNWQNQPKLYHGCYVVNPVNNYPTIRTMCLSINGNITVQGAPPPWTPDGWIGPSQ